MGTRFCCQTGGHPCPSASDHRLAPAGVPARKTNGWRPVQRMHKGPAHTAGGCLQRPRLPSHQLLPTADQRGSQLGVQSFIPEKKNRRARCLPRPGRYAERAASSRPAAGRRSIAGAPHRSFFPRHTIATEHSKARTNYNAGHDLTTGRLGCEQRHSTVLRRRAELNSASLLGPRWKVS